MLFLEDDLVNILKASIIEGVDKLEEIHPEFYNYLISEKFLVSKQVNELDEIKKIQSSVDNNHATYLLTINPTMNCNFKCWYCYETHIKSSKLSKNVLDATKLFISKTLKLENIKFFNLSFFGGEPLLYFNQVVKPLIEHTLQECKKNNVNYGVSFTTNGFLVNDEFINFFLDKKISPSLQITFDGYGKNHDKVRYVNENRGSYSEIVENIKKLLIHDNFFVRARVNYTDENINDCFKIANDFDDLDKIKKQNQMLFDFHRVWQNGKLDEIDIIVNENIQKIKEKGFKTSVNLPDNLINSCYADKINSSVINYNGDIFKCTARDFESKNREGYLTQDGEIIWENNSLINRMNSKFKNKPCLSCRILPLCNGGCSQQAIENVDNDYCIYSGVDSEKDKVIIKKIEEIIASQLQEV